MAKTNEELEEEIASLKEELKNASTKIEKEEIINEINQLKEDLMTWKESQKTQQKQPESPEGKKVEEIPTPPPPVTNKELEQPVQKKSRGMEILKKILG